MAFSWVYNDFGSTPRRVGHILATNNEAFVKGEAVKIASGRWTKAGNGDAVAGFTTQKLDAGTDKVLEVALAREGDWYDAPYTGTPDAGFVVGVGTADVSTDGLSILASDITGGAFAVEDINTNTKTCRVKVKNRQL
ncbi:hypothetical protein [Paenibacillus polymyxa]|uniref:hypothetical protein n=1 Tax=Paenibacillus polymyxa TaxID=1406 RepID=UPI00129A330A|nr:hypothetical protein [Paenibacillus polymyxa]KAE8559790.1 hypothetical protein BJH92_12480 [Paenibacillus polymyxa]MCJ1222270.1 hypothetical protein [Paenibacillus polymyxa]